jgi:glutathione S-transferase
MDKLTLQNPVFAAYALAAALVILKAVAMSWLTVARMMQFSSGLRSPEDLQKGPANPSPHPEQLLPDERVDRIRRIQLNDLENLPFFLAAGFLFVLTQPSLLTAQWLFYGYVASRLAHFVAYLTAQRHEVRAGFWTVGSLIIVYMAVRTLLAAAGV